MRNRRTARIALVATMVVYLCSAITLVSLDASGAFDGEVPLISTPLPTSITTPLTPIPTPTAPMLISPEDNEILDNGRMDFMDYMVWDFDWSDVKGATRYQLFVISPLGLAYIDKDNIRSSSYHLKSLGYQSSDCLAGWTWGVRAYCNGQWNEWSDTRNFDVEPPNTDPPWDTTIPLSLIPTPTPTTAPTVNVAQKQITIDRLYEIEGLSPFILPLHFAYILALLFEQSDTMR